MFKLKREKGTYYLHYIPTKFLICSLTLEAAIRHLMLIQSILAGNGEETAKIMRNGPRISGKTTQFLAHAIHLHEHTKRKS